MSQPLTESPNLVAVPPVELDRAVILDRTSYPDWGSMFSENGDRLHYLLTPDDYRHWGTLRLENMPGNTPGRPKTIRYYNPGLDDDVHPVMRTSEALVASFQFEGETDSWLVQGLTVRRPTDNPGISRGASNITIDRCLIEQASRQHLRIRDAAHCTVQRCVIRESTPPNEGTAESSGIQISAIKTGTVNIRLLDNEIYNVGDGIQITDGPDPADPIEVLIEGNDIYLTQSRHILDPDTGLDTNTTLDENAIDLKGGSDTAQSTVIRGNRMWGYRRNAVPTALGELLVIQRYSRNVLVTNNIFGDAPRGMKDVNWPTGEGIAVDTPRGITFSGNQFHDIRDYAPTLDAGAVTRPVTAGISFTDNHVARSDCLVDVAPPGGFRGAGPTYTRNVLIEVGHVQRPGSTSTVAIHPADNNTVATAPNGYHTYERRRWTGPELHPGALPMDA